LASAERPCRQAFGVPDRWPR